MFPDQIIECSILQGICGICIAELTRGNFWYIVADSWSLRTQTSRYSGKHFLFPSYFFKTVETNYLLLQPEIAKAIMTSRWTLPLAQIYTMYFSLTFTQFASLSGCNFKSFYRYSLCFSKSQTISKEKIVRSKKWMHLSKF